MIQDNTPVDAVDYLDKYTPVCKRNDIRSSSAHCRRKMEIYGIYYGKSAQKTKYVLIFPCIRCKNMLSLIS